MQADSPAIDTASLAGTPDHDLDGVARPFDGDEDGVALPDMGAYEFFFLKLYLPLGLKD